MIKRLVFTVMFTLALALGASAQTSPQVVAGAAASSGKPEDLRRTTFEIVWRTVKEKHYDPTLGGVNWDKVRQQYEPRALAAASDQELYRVLQEMLGELHQSHFNIIPPEAIIPDDEREPGGSIGIDLRLIDGEAVITHVESDSAAARAGLRTGFVIKKVGEKNIVQIIDLIAKSNQPATLKNVRITRRILNEINGEPGSAVKVTFLDGSDLARELTVTREKLKGELSPRFGNFPPQYIEFESKRLAGNLGYIRFNVFAIPVIEKTNKAIRDYQDAEGIIFDLRGNPGGVGGIAAGLAGRLTDKGGSLGTMKTRTGELKFAVFPQQSPYTGPIIILIDSMSGSTSEIFAGGMQELGRAIVVGERSAGACLPSYFQKLPTGAIFQFAIADFKTPKGVLVEGRGVAPDIELKWNRR